jgi:hypothetical protein
MKNIQKIGILVAVVLAAGAAITSSAAAQERPYRASLNYIGLGFPCGAYSGSGTALHLGATSESGTYCAQEWVGEALLHLTGQGTQIAANGSNLTYVFDEIVDFTTEPFTAEGTFTITGGTGRFAAATGSGTFHTIGTSIQGGFSLSINYDGRITY